jgi:MFS family permease
MPDHDQEVALMFNTNPSPGAALGFRRLWASTAATNLADGFAHLIVPVSAVTGGANPLQLSIVVAAQTTPWLVLSPSAGLVADRVSVRSITRTAGFLRIVACFGLLSAITSPSNPILLLAIVGAALGSGEVFTDIAAQSAVPDVVGDPDLEFAYGRIKSTQIAGDSLLGPGLGGVLLAVGPSAAVIPMIGLFVIGAVLVPNTARHEATNTTSSRRRDLMAGWHATWRDAWIRRALLAVAVMNFGSGVAATALVAFAVEPGPLELSEAQYGFLLAAVGVGSILGGLLAQRLESQLATSRLIQLGAAGYVLVIAAPAITSTAAVLVVLMFTGSMLGMTFAIKVISTRQRRVDPTVRGRVNAVFQTIGGGTAPLGALVGGIALTHLDFRTTFTATAVVVAVTVTLARPWHLDHTPGTAETFGEEE